VRYKKEDKDKVEGGTKSESDGETYSWKAATGYDPLEVNESGSTNGPYFTKNSVCPPGWHVSTTEEWRILVDLADNLAQDFLSTTGWKNNGTNKFGLNIKNTPIVYWYRDVPDHSIGPTYWTSSYRGSSKAPDIVRFEDGYTDVDYGGFAYYFENAFYVRCVKDRKAKPPVKVPKKSKYRTVPCIDIFTGQKQLCDEESFL
jgi:uncharacterized protein (TIGR02145 family)